MAGEFQCMDCQHLWVGVAPLGTVWVDCPACGSGRGHPRYPAIPETYWACTCGNSLFHLMPDGRARCPRCGEAASDWP